MAKVNSSRFLKPVYNLVLFEDNEKEILAIIADTQILEISVIHKNMKVYSEFFMESLIYEAVIQGVGHKKE